MIKYLAKTAIGQSLRKNQFIEDFIKSSLSFIPYRYRILNKVFYEFLDFLIECEDSSYDVIKKYQFEQVKNLVNIAYNFTDFYHKKYNKAGFHPDMLNSYEDIEKIPIITSSDIRQHSLNMIDRRCNYKKLDYGFTSGTTGTALKLYYDKTAVSKEWASVCYQWRNVGYKPGDGRVELRGFLEANTIHKFMPYENVLRINIIKMDDDNISQIIDQIKKYNYKFVHGYPSAIYKFAKLISKHNINYSPDGIMFASEMLYDWQLSEIDKVFKCLKTAHYGQAERVAFGGWGVDDNRYFFLPAYGLVELDNYTGTLIATSLINKSMPIIRYRLTDAIENFQEIPKNNDKMLFPVVDAIKGREEDLTYDEHMNMIPPAVVTFPFKHLEDITAAKFIQYDINKFEIVLEVADKEDIKINDEINYLITSFQEIYGNNAKFKVTTTKCISRSQNGKFKWIVNMMH